MQGEKCLDLGILTSIFRDKHQIARVLSSIRRGKEARGWYLSIVPLSAQSKHLIKALAPGHEPAEAPECAATKIAPADSLKFTVSLHFEHADSRANINKEVGKQVFVSCSQQAIQMKTHATGMPMCNVQGSLQAIQVNNYC